MKFFKSHSVKYKGYKVIIVPEKFDDIRNDAFKGISPEYIVFSESTQIIRNYAFSGVDECNIFIPDSVSEIEDGAFDDMGENVVIYCNQGSYADGRCVELGIKVSYEMLDIASLIEEQERMLKKPEPAKEIEELPIAEKDDEPLVDASAETSVSTENESKAISDNAPIPEIVEKDEPESVNEEYENIVPSEENETNVIVDVESTVDDENQRVAENTNESQNENSENSSPIEQHQENNVRCMMFDEMYGISESFIRYEGLSESIKSHITDGELYVQSKYDDGNRSTIFISKAEFEKLVMGGMNSQKASPATEIKCPYCNENISPEDTFCAMCGRKIKNVVKCPRCNEPNDANDNFCAYCGKKLLK